MCSPHLCLPSYCAVLTSKLPQLDSGFKKEYYKCLKLFCFLFLSRKFHSQNGVFSILKYNILKIRKKYPLKYVFPSHESSSKWKSSPSSVSENLRIVSAIVKETLTEHNNNKSFNIFSLIGNLLFIKNDNTKVIK